VSADPLVVACPVSSSAAIHRMVQHQRRFAVSLPAPDRGPRRWRAGPHTGAPLLADSVAWLECRLTAICAEPSGPVLLGEVLGSFWSSCRDALAFAGLSAA
jgi:flavin reductase (DIM6/NTAB) family NADH-FMN oxidoreductase RutF